MHFPMIRIFRHLAFGLLAALLAPLGVAEEAPAELAMPETPDVRIIVDISGSMRANDPDNLRRPAVRLLARMLPEGSTAGLWTFGQYVNMLVPHGKVTDDWRATAIERSEAINSVALRTNLGKAIEVASDPYLSGGSLANTHFILLTDGKVDISNDAGVNQAEETRILKSLVTDLAAQGATVHPVALSSEADAGFLETLAETTGGSFRIAGTADALSIAFADALNSAVPQAQVPIEGNGFQVDSGVREFTALIFWGRDETRASRELALVRPDGSTTTLNDLPANVRWARESGYDLITITDPMAGQWRIEGELGEGSRVTVVSDLNMMVSPVPTTFSAAEPIDLQIAFFESEEKITNPDFLKVLDVRLTITSEDGRSGSKTISGERPPSDGVYGDTIEALPAPGVYQVEVIAESETFARKFSATTEFKGPPVSEPDVAVKPEPESEPERVSEPEPAPVIPAPIDISQVEVPDKKPPAPEQQPWPWVPVAAAAGGVMVLGLLGWFGFRLRRRRAEVQASAAATRETVEDLEIEEAPEPEAADQSLSEETVADEEIPIAEVEPGSESETEPGPEPENEPETEDDEFGLEDFDISEFDDLPEADEPPSETNDDEPEDSPGDKDSKK